MPPPLLTIPKSGAAIAAAADAEPQANAAAAPSEDGSGAPNGRTAQLFQQLSALFAAQRAGGAALGTPQDAASFAATDAALRRLMAEYCADPTADWARCGRAPRRAPRGTRTGAAHWLVGAFG
jgi:hypothetical protein